MFGFAPGADNEFETLGFHDIEQRNTGFEFE